MPAKPKPIDRGHIIDARRNGEGREGRDIKPPTVFNGRPITQKPLRGPHDRVIAPRSEQIRLIDTAVMRQRIENRQREWNVNDHDYHWENWDGRQVGHYYDTHGFHWWGFYVGDVYFWTRYYNSLYWWYDPYWHRWCYLNNGQWWWQNPDTQAVYVYSDDGYSAYDDTDGGVVLTPDATPPVDAPPADDGASAADQPVATYMSVDGSRMVQVYGDDKAAYLTDTTAAPAFTAPVYLASGVTEVRFQYNAAQSLTQILTIGADGSFQLFDSVGNPLDQQPVPAPVAAPDAGDGGQTQPNANPGLRASSAFQRLSGDVSGIFGR